MDKDKKKGLTEIEALAIVTPLKYWGVVKEDKKKKEEDKMTKEKRMTQKELIDLINKHKVVKAEARKFKRLGSSPETLNILTLGNGDSFAFTDGEYGGFAPFKWFGKKITDEIPFDGGWE